MGLFYVILIIMEDDVMNLEEKKKGLEWYDNPTLITNLIIGLIALIIILSQSFAINNNLSTTSMLRNILNHNSTYLIVLVYFVFLKTKFGKKYFDFLNLFLILLYFITFITSILTVFQSFGLSTLLSLALHALLFVYLFHTFLRGTRFWKEFSLEKSPFNELTNDWYFYAIVIVSISVLAVQLISVASFDGTVLAVFDWIYALLFARYIYLYFVFLEKKKKNTHHSGNFDKYKEKAAQLTQNIKEKVQDVYENFDMDEKINDVKEKISDVVSGDSEVEQKVEKKKSYKQSSKKINKEKALKKGEK